MTSPCIIQTNVDLPLKPYPNVVMYWSTLKGLICQNYPYCVNCLIQITIIRVNCLLAPNQPA